MLPLTQRYKNPGTSISVDLGGIVALVSLSKRP